jgi:hypothetical protein
VPNSWNQPEYQRAPHNPALTITDEGLSNRARYEAHLDHRDYCRRDPAHCMDAQKALVGCLAHGWALSFIEKVFHKKSSH